MGSPRITAESNDTPQEGDGQVDHKQVDRLMRAAGTRRPTGDGAGCAPPGPADLTSRPLPPPIAGTSVVFPHCVGGTSFCPPLAEEEICIRLPSSTALGRRLITRALHLLDHRGIPAGRGCFRDPAGYRPPH